MAAGLVDVCEECGAPGAGPCHHCAVKAVGPVVRAMIVPDPDGEPIVVLGDRRIPWSVFGQAVGPATLTVVARPSSEPAADTSEVSVLASGAMAPVREPVDDVEEEAWDEAVALLRDCLPPEEIPPCPNGALAAACANARAGFASGEDVWLLAGEAAGWSGEPPDSDRDLWTGAALALVSVSVDRMDPELAHCLDAMELDDWMATILELVRSGEGTPADPDSLLALSARCLDVDSGAVDPDQAPLMAGAFDAVLPVWQALGAVDADERLTPLGAWGLPHALARAWAGSLE